MSTSGTLRDLMARLLPGERSDPDEAALFGEPTSRELRAATLTRLGLTEQPFHDHAAPDALFADDAIRMQIDALRGQLARGEMIPLLKGEPGSGKTSLLIQLMAGSADSHHFFIVRGQRNLTAQRAVIDMLRILVRPVPDDAGQCFRELARRLRSIATEEAPAVLVIDRADALPDIELNHLLAVHDSLDRALGGRFRILLAADPDFELRIGNLQSRQIDAGQILAMNMRPLQRPRIGPYLEHRLRQAGMVGPLPLEAADLDRIAAEAEPLPRPVEAAAAELLNRRHGGDRTPR